MVLVVEGDRLLAGGRVRQALLPLVLQHNERLQFRDEAQRVLVALLLLQVDVMVVLHFQLEPLEGLLELPEEPLCVLPEGHSC